MTFLERLCLMPHNFSLKVIIYFGVCSQISHFQYTILKDMPPRQFPLKIIYKKMTCTYRLRRISDALLLGLSSRRRCQMPKIIGRHEDD